MNSTEITLLGVGGSILALGGILLFTNMMNKYYPDSPNVVDTVHIMDAPEYNPYGGKRKKTRRSKRKTRK